MWSCKVNIILLFVFTILFADLCVLPLRIQTNCSHLLHIQLRSCYQDWTQSRSSRWGGAVWGRSSWSSWSITESLSTSTTPCSWSSHHSLPNHEQSWAAAVGQPCCRRKLTGASWPTRGVQGEFHSSFPLSAPSSKSSKNIFSSETIKLQSGAREIIWNGQ